MHVAGNVEPTVASREIDHWREQEAETQRQTDHRDDEVHDPEGQHQNQVGERRPGSPVLEHFADARPESRRIVRMHRTPRHAFARHGLDQPPFRQRYHAGERYEYQKEGDADDQHGEPGGQRQTGHRQCEINDAGGQGQEHEKQRRVGARVQKHAEECTGPALRNPARRGHRRLNLRLGVAVGARDLVRSAVGGRDQFEYIGLGLVRMRSHFCAQIFFGVIQGILNECGVLPRQLFAQLPKVLIDGARRAASHDEGPFSMNRSTKPRVPTQMADHSASTWRPCSVMR